MAAAVKKCYDSYGTSYLVQWNSDAFGIARVTTPSPATVPRTTTYTRAVSKKMLFGDWNFHANRAVNVLQGQWHNYGGRNRYNMGFLDGHSEFFEFPANWNTTPAGTAPDPDLRAFW
jgi:prepilin-type processing-associated H-X9-DG protein